MQLLLYAQFTAGAGWYPAWEIKLTPNDKLGVILHHPISTM